MSTNKEAIRTYQIIIVVIIIIALVNYAIDLCFSLRYIYKIERKVGKLLLQFVIIDKDEVKKMLAIISNF